MRGLRRIRASFLLMLPAVFVLMGGCGSIGRMARPADTSEETPAGTARMPAVFIRAEPPPDAIPLPHSVADEDKGRWLTLFVLAFPPPPPSPATTPPEGTEPGFSFP